MPRLASSKVIDQIAKTITDGAVVPNNRVYTSRFWPLAEDELPAIRVVAEDETIEATSIGLPLRLVHELPVSVDCYVRAVDDADDSMHEIAYGVMLALFGTDEAATLQPLTSVVMTPSGITRGVGEGDEAALARISVRLLVRYQTRSNAPENLSG